MTIAAPSQHREDVKGSVFLAYAERADTVDAALCFLKRLATDFSDASHVCWAYRIGLEYRYSDAGEPGGTAGQPIYRAIEGQCLDHVVVGVVRYFGGTKLGAGGLMRAYGGVAAEALRRAPTITESPLRCVEIGVSFAHLGELYHLLDSFGVVERLERFDERGIHVRVKLGDDALTGLHRALRDATRDTFSWAAEDDTGESAR